MNAGPSGRLEERIALAGLAFILAVTGAWWAFALWPLPESAPRWLERAQVVCFSLTDSGLPDAAGWMLLIGQPVAMAVALRTLAGGSMHAALVRLVRSGTGRTTVALVLLAGAAGVAAAAVRVAGAVRPETPRLLPPPAAEEHPRLGRELPAFALVDQHGREAGPERLQGGAALVTFAFGHCETVCPVVVRSALEARRALEGEVELTVVVVTLDPWRDTPDRLGWLAQRWGLGADELVLGGSVPAVEAALDAWEVSRVRDPRTGDVQHVPLVYLVGADGRVAFAAGASTATLVALARRL